METIRQNRMAVDAKYTADLAEITRKRDTGKNDTAASNAKAELVAGVLVLGLLNLCIPKITK